MHPARLSIDLLLQSCEVTTTRRGGPGGQHRNKTETAVVIQHASGVIGQATERRSQDLNRDEALHRLRLNLAVEVRTEPDTELSATWLDFSTKPNNRVSVNNHNFPAILSEALDHLQACRFELNKTAQRLNVSSAKLVSLIRTYPPALLNCNRQRDALGLHPLR